MGETLNTVSPVSHADRESLLEMSTINGESQENLLNDTFTDIIKLHLCQIPRHRKGSKSTLNRSLNFGNTSVLSR